MYLLRALGVLLSTAYYGSISLVFSFVDGTGRRQHEVAHTWACFLLRIAGIRLKVEGLEHIRRDGAYVIVSNHLSFFDTPVLLAAIPVQFRFMAKYGLFQIPLLGTHLKRAGHLPVYRDDPRSGIRTMNTAAEAIKDKRISVLVFPEGGRSPDGELQEFRDGATYIAIRAGAEVVPVGLYGTREVLAFGSGRIRPAEVTLRIGEPIATAGMSMKQRHALTAQMQACIRELTGPHPAVPAGQRSA